MNIVFWNGSQFVLFQLQVTIFCQFGQKKNGLGASAVVAMEKKQEQIGAEARIQCFID